MIVDALTKVSADQQVTADAASGNTIDLGNVTPKRQVGSGESLAAVMAIKAVGTNTGSSKVQVVQSSSADLSSPNIIGEVDLAAGDLIAGKVVVIPLPPGYPTKRYIGMYHDITGTVDYTVDAYIGPRSFEAPAPQSYASGYTIS